MVGAGANPSGLGHVVLRNLLEGGFEGVVYPVNPGHESIHGVQAYAAVGDTPETPDLAVVCTPASTVPDVVQACGEAGVGAVAVISAGFRETGPEGAALEAEVARRGAAFDGLRVLGPNCLGLIVPSLGLNASFAASMPGDGHVAFVTQSGALATSLIDWAQGGRVGFSHVVSLGNMMDVDLGDMIDYLGQSPGTRSIILYVENVTNPRKFMSAARAFALGKPIVAYKAGRFAASAKPRSRTPERMAGEDSVYDAAFERAGIVRVDRIEDVFATAELLAHERRPSGPRLAIVTNAGGPGVMAADTLIARGGLLAEPGQDTAKTLAEALPASASIDESGGRARGRPAGPVGGAVTALLADRGVRRGARDPHPPGDDRSDGGRRAVARAGDRQAKAAARCVAWAAPRWRPGLARVRAGGRAGIRTFPSRPWRRSCTSWPTRATSRPCTRHRERCPCPSPSTARRVKDLMGTILSEGDGCSPRLRQGAARRVRDPGDQAPSGRHRRGCRGRGRDGSAIRWCSRFARPT